MKYDFYRFLAWMMCFSTVSTEKGNNSPKESIPNDQTAKPISHQHHEPRKIRYQTLVDSGAMVFSMPDIDTYKALLIDATNGTPWGEGIYVGARNWMIKFNMSLQQKPKALKLPPSPEQIERCKGEGKPVADCHNFIKFLDMTKIGDVGTVIACGTYAHSPNCFVLLATSLTEEMKRLKGLSAGNPHVDVAGYAFNDEVYIGISAESRGSSGKILYTTWKKDARTIRSMIGKRWLDDVQFVGAFSPTKDHKFVYFVFRELAIDALVPNSTYSRVGRICKQDNGAVGNYKDYFASFTKAYLVCGDYHQVQHVSHNENDPYFWATFSGGALNNGSVICSYKIMDLELVFESSYFHPDPDDGRWRENPPPQLYRWNDMVETCYGIRSMKAIMQYTMMSSTLLPNCGRTAFVTNGNFNKIATVYGEDYDFVVFAGDELGRVWRINFTNMYDCQDPTDIHIWEVIPRSESSKEINLLRVFDDALIVLTNKAVMKVPVWYDYPEVEEEPTTTTKIPNENSTSKPKKEQELETESEIPIETKTQSEIGQRTREQPNDSHSRSGIACSQNTLFVVSIPLLTF